MPIVPPPGTIFPGAIAALMGVSIDTVADLMWKTDNIKPAKRYRNNSLWFADEVDVFIEEWAFGVKKQKGNPRRRL